MTDTDKLKRLAEAATAGPWGWHGNQHDIYLATKDRGRIYVMGFDRMGFRSAQPTFRVGSRIKKASEIVSFEVGDDTVRGFAEAKENESVYRYDVTGVDAPDAQYIAAASPDVILYLIAENDRLKECMSGPAAWIERWAGHVGGCRADDGMRECTCGLEAARFDISRIKDSE